jgi:hypothetical protein
VKFEFIMFLTDSTVAASAAAPPPSGEKEDYLFDLRAVFGGNEMESVAFIKKQAVLVANASPASQLQVINLGYDVVCGWGVFFFRGCLCAVSHRIDTPV